MFVDALNCLYRFDQHFRHHVGYETILENRIICDPDQDYSIAIHFSMRYDSKFNLFECIMHMGLHRNFDREQILMQIRSINMSILCIRIHYQDTISSAVAKTYLEIARD